MVEEKSRFFHENSIDLTEMTSVILEEYCKGEFSEQKLDEIVVTFLPFPEIHGILGRIALSKKVSDNVRLYLTDFDDLFPEDSGELVNSLVEQAFFEENEEISKRLLRNIANISSEIQLNNINNYLKKLDKNPTIQQKLRMIKICYILYSESYDNGWKGIFGYIRSNFDNRYRTNLITAFMLEATSQDVRIAATQCFCAMYKALGFKSINDHCFEVIIETVKEALASDCADQVNMALDSLIDLKNILVKKIPYVLQVFKEIASNEELPVKTRLNGLIVLRMYFDERFIDKTFFKVIFDLVKQVISSFEYNGEYTSVLFPKRKWCDIGILHIDFKKYFILMMNILAREKDPHQFIFDFVEDQNSDSICSAFFCFPFFINSTAFAHNCVTLVIQSLDESNHLMTEIAWLNLTNIFRFSLTENTTDEFFDYIPLWFSCISDINTDFLIVQLPILEDVIVKSGDLIVAHFPILMEKLLGLCCSKNEKIRMLALSVINRIVSIAGFVVNVYIDYIIENFLPRLRIDSRELADFQISCGSTLVKIMKVCFPFRIQKHFPSIEELAFECLNHWNYKKMRLGLILFEGLYSCFSKISKTKLRKLLKVLPERVQEYLFETKEKITEILEEINEEEDLECAEDIRKLHEAELSDFYAVNTSVVSLYATLAKGYKYDFFKIHELTTILYPLIFYFKGLEIEKYLTSLMKIIMGLINVIKIPTSEESIEEMENFEFLELLVEYLFKLMNDTFPYCELEFYDMFLKCLSKLSNLYLSYSSKISFIEIIKKALKFEFIGIGESLSNKYDGKKSKKDLPITAEMVEKLFRMFLYAIDIMGKDTFLFSELPPIFVEKYKDNSPNIRYLVIHFAKKNFLRLEHFLGTEFKELAMSGILDEDINVKSAACCFISTLASLDQNVDYNVAIEAMLKTIEKDNFRNYDICSSLCRTLQYRFLRLVKFENFVETLLCTVSNQQKLVFNVDLLNFLCFLLDEGRIKAPLVEKVFRIFEIFLERPTFKIKICRKIAETVSYALDKNEVPGIQKYCAKVMCYMKKYLSVFQKNAKVSTVTISDCPIIFNGELL